MLAAFEHHVFHEMGDAKLVLFLHEGADFYHQTEIGSLLRLFVGADVIGQTVAENASANGRVRGQYLFLYFIGMSQYLFFVIFMRTGCCAKQND
jgi:hypothetical protein